DPEDERRDAHEPKRLTDLDVPERARDRAATRWLGGGARRAERPRSQHDRQTGQPDEHLAGPDVVGKRADRRSEQGPEDRRADRGPERRSTSREGGAGDEPGECSGPG